MGAYELAFIGLAGSGVGTALGVPMVWPRSNRPFDVRLLGSAALFMSAAAALISARLAGLAPASAATEHTINLLGLCTFPLLVMYARHAVQAPITHAQAAWWAPAVVYGTAIAVRAAAGSSTRVPFAWLAPIVCSFTIAAAITLWRHRHQRRPVVVPAAAVVGFVALLNAAQLVRMEFGYIAVVRALVPLVMSVGFLAMAGYAAWRVSPGRGAGPLSRGAGPLGPASSPSPITRPHVPYERSGLEEEAARQLLARVEQALGRDRMYARTDLTLAHLAAAVDATPHQLSEALNRFAGASFADVVNRRRVDDVKAQLLDPANDRFTIEGIGASAGFGSRSALYTAFRRLEGMTPTEFRKLAVRS